MGLLSSIGKAVKKTVQTIAKPIASAAAVVAQPIKTIQAIASPTKTVKQVQQEFFSQPKSTQAAQFAINAAAIGGGVLLGAAGKLGAVAKAIIPTTTKGKVAAVVAAPIVYGVATTAPKETTKALISAPSELAQFGGDIAKVATSPSLESAKQLVSNSPILTSAAVIAGGVAVGKIAAPVVSGLLTREAVQEQTKVLESAVLNGAPSDTSSFTSNLPLKPTAPQTPITPETKPLIATAGASRSTAKGRRKRVKASPSINQRVNVIVSNRSTSTGIKQVKERLLNRQVLFS